MENKEHKRRLLSVATKPFVPPVGTIIMDRSRSGFFSAVVVLPDHRLLEVQRGNYAGLELGHPIIFSTPFDWQSWLRRV